MANFLGIKNVLCNKFETDEYGLITGEVVRPVLWGPGKANAAQHFAANNGVDLAQSYFYADGAEDLPLMLEVGNPRPVNPRPGLAAAATEHGWPVLRVGRPARRRSGNGRASG